MALHTAMPIFVTFAWWYKARVACLGVNLHLHRVHSHPSLLQWSASRLYCTWITIFILPNRFDGRYRFVISEINGRWDDAEAVDAVDELLLFVLCVAVCVEDDEGDRDEAVVVSSGGSWSSSPTLYCDASTMVEWLVQPLLQLMMCRFWCCCNRKSFLNWISGVGWI